jgi:dTMP kinase
VSDRFADSTTAYQGYGRGFDPGQIRAINAFATRGARPDLTVLLDLEAEVGFERMRRRNAAARRPQDRFEREELEFHRRVRAGYLEMARGDPGRIRVVDGSRPPEEVSAAVWEMASRLLAGRA